MRRIIGSIGGVIFGFTFALILEIIRAFPSSFLFIFCSSALCGGLTAVLGFCFPTRLELFSFFINFFINGDLDFEDLSPRVAVAAMAFFIGTFLMLIAVITQSSLLGFIGVIMITPFSYYSLSRPDKLQL